MTGDKPAPSYFRRIKSNPNAFLHKLSLSDAGDHRCIKAIFGVLSGVFAGGLLYTLLVFSFDYNYVAAGWISLGITLLLCAGLAVSTIFRCTVVLMVPTLLTGRGRVAILAAIFGILLSGPVTNISENASQVSNSMACTSELIYNQSQMLRGQLEEPIRHIAKQIINSFEAVRKIGEELQKGLEPVSDLLDKMEESVRSAANELKKATQRCSSDVQRVHTTCVSKVNQVKSDCETQVNVIENTVKDGVKKGIDAVTDGIDKATGGVGGAINNIGGFLGRKRRRKRSCDWLPPWPQFPAKPSLHRYRRGILSGVCSILDVSDACDVLKVGSSLCKVLTAIGGVVNAASTATKGLLDTVTNFFVFGIKSNQDLDGKINSSQSASQIMANVQADIKARTDLIKMFVTVTKYILAIPLLFLFIRSSVYVNKYRFKDYFDNKYISKRFKKYDDRRKSQGKASVLPLKKSEKRRYVETRSIWLSNKELRHFLVGSRVVILHFLIALAVIAADYVLFYILAILQKYGDVNISVSGKNVVNLHIMGDGFIAKFLQALSGGVNIDTDFAVNFNITRCLPSPKPPSVNVTFVLIALYITAFVFMFTQAYGLRMRRKIAAYFFPKQEFARIQYLHEAIRLKRKSNIEWVGQNVKSRRKQNAVSARATLAGFLFQSCNCDMNLSSTTTCLACGEEYTGVTPYHVCTTNECDGVYCLDCFREMNNQCVVCKTKHSSINKKRGKSLKILF